MGPKGPKSPKSPLERLKAPVRYTSSSSLSGMEKVSPLSSAGTLPTPSSIVSDVDKPLPLPPKSLSPRKSSSVYSLHTEAAKIQMTKSRGDLLPQYDPRPLPPRAYSAKPEAKGNGRLKLVKLSGSESKSDPVLDRGAMYGREVVARTNFPGQHERPAGITQSSKQEQAPRPDTLQDRTMHYFATNETFDPAKGEQVEAVSKKPIWQTGGTIQTPKDRVIDATYSDQSYLPESMSPRIIDVIDHSLVPSPLHVDAGNVSPTHNNSLRPEMESRPSSSFSSDSSHSSISSIIDSYLSKSRRTKKTKRLRTKPSKRKSSSESTQKGRKGSQTSSTFSRLSSSFSATRGRLGSVASHRRKSVQRGIDNMYDTLARFSLAPKAVPPLNRMNPHKKGIPRERRSPAIPITPYQMYGKKAWEMEKAAKNPKKPKFRVSTKGQKPSAPHRVSTRVQQYEQLRYSTLMNPPKTAPLPSDEVQKNRRTIVPDEGANMTKANHKSDKPAKQTKEEKRREELKKKIIVIGIGEGRPASGGPWI